MFVRVYANVSGLSLYIFTQHAEALCPPTALAIADNNALPSVYALAQVRLDPLCRWLETEGAMLPWSEHLITGDIVLLVYVCVLGGCVRVLVPSNVFSSRLCMVSTCAQFERERERE